MCIMRYQLQINSGIKRLRAQHNLTQEKFAEIVGLTVEAVRNLEHNKYAPNAKTIDAICNSFNIRPIDLLIDDITKENVDVLQIIQYKLNSSSIAELRIIDEMIDVVRRNYISLRNK